jgi:hypothetical protein
MPLILVCVQRSPVGMSQKISYEQRLFKGLNLLIFANVSGTNVEDGKKQMD